MMRLNLVLRMTDKLLGRLLVRAVALGVVLVCSVSVCSPVAFAQDKVIENMRMIGVGNVNILDTYLSTEKYSGTELRYMSHTLREREGRQWSRLIVHQGFVAYGKNRADNGNEMAGTYTFSYGLLYDWKMLSGRLDLKAGGKIDAVAGFLYNTRNGNNPAQARLSVDISPTAIATYRFNMGRMPVAVKYEVGIPLFGLMFSPNYGQSYYEIFSEGNYDHNVVATTVATAPSLSQMLAVDFKFGKTTVSVGYLGDWRQAKVNNLKYHTYSNLFMIGLTRKFKMIRM